VNQAPITNEDLRRALEALRNGVPNRDAVRVLGCGQDEVVQRFERQLEDVEVTMNADHQARGILVAGGYGSGKSHLLEYLKHLALERNFVCSLIVISKETPLYDPAKVYLAAIQAAEVPHLTGNAIQEIGLQLRQNSSLYADFFMWANRGDNSISPVFPATLLLHERLSGDPEMLEKVRGFWSGERLSVTEIRRGLRQIGHAAAYQLRTVPARELPFQRFKFAARLMRAAGYRGWVMLIDEMELIARYSRLQRARSYSELARWLGRVESDQYPGLTSVCTITDDFAGVVLQEKGDLDYVVPQLQARNNAEYSAIASRAETGMRIIQREAIPLEAPTRDGLRKTYEALKGIHSEAYNWNPPELPSAAPSVTGRMRSYVRRWINEWDLNRLYPGEAIQTVETELRVDYTESRELEEQESSTDNSQPDF
jgi:hypothetical protein